MKPISVPSVITLVFTLIFCSSSQAQTFTANASAVWISNCSQSDFFNTTGSIGPAGNAFTGANLGTYTTNSGSLVLRGGEVRTSTTGSAKVCGAHMYYRVYQQSGTPGAFNAIDLPFADNCDISTSSFPSGGSCSAGDQKWNRVIDDGTTNPYSPVDLTAYGPGNYVLEVYYDVSGSSAGTDPCTETFPVNNGGSNYKAYFSIQEPSLSSTNPTTCNGSEGSITISGLTAGASYQISYTDDGNTVGPTSFTANGSGQVVISGLKAGLYSDFELQVNQCVTDLNTALRLSDPIITPKFNKIAAFCAGTTAPTLPTTSTNGITGTWSPSVINNQQSGTYTFTPNTGQCGVSVTMNVTVTPRTVPTFSFGTSSTICAGASVPTLPNTSNNSISGTWSPATVDNQHSATYTFTPSGSQCATNTTFTVTVNPNVAPTFSIGTSLTICAGGSVPALPSTSNEGIAGTWSPATVNNQNSGTYTFTPNAGLCATTATFNVTVNPNVTPTFSFGTASTICAGGSVPTLPATSTNAITGSWSPATVDNQHSATYTFTPDAGQCATTTTFNVTVNPNVVPAFSFGTSLAICAGASVPTLPSASTNSITGTWSPATVDNQHSGTYTFTPDPGQCATTTTFNVTVNPNVAPTFSFGTSLTICAGGSVPSLPATSKEGISGTWSPTTVDNQNSGTYTFTPAAGQCATAATFTVTVNPNVTPTFSFGTSLTICAGGGVPALPATSDNGIAGSWNPTVVSNQASGVYTFTPAAGSCAPPVTFSVNVTPNATPTFAFGTALTICAGGTVPTLPGTSTNSVTGTWSPSAVDNQNSGTYTFTPASGQCATTTTFNVTVNPNVTPTFSFGTALTICAGASVPALSTTSDNGISGTWSPSVIDNQNSRTYTFTPSAGQCAVTTSLTVTVTPNTTPAFSIGSTLTICAGGSVPSLPSTSDNGVVGTWSPATIDNQHSGTYTFSPGSGQCATSTTFTVTVNPNLTPAFNFGTAISICAGSSAPSLPATSTNGISGTWSPATIDNQNSGTYTFTPGTGQCAVPTSLNVTVNPVVTPTFNFGTTLTICAGSAVPTLATTSNNGIAGSWSPASVDNQHSATYTFIPGSGQCATSTTFTVTVNPNTVPTFSFGTTLTICAGASVPSLPSTSDNGITGTWSPAAVDNQHSGTYTFTPGAGPCATSVTFTVTVNPNVTPTFSFGTSYSICAGGTVPVLDNTSSNGVVGTWSPATVDNQHSATYTFTPNAGQCAMSASFTVTVNPIVAPTFSFGNALDFCQGASVPNLPATSDNGITGTWSAAAIDNQKSATYVFTPSGGQCATTASLSVTVHPNMVPSFSFGTSLTTCAGSAVPALPTVSTNGLSGSWSPATVDNQASGVYTFTPDPVSGQCLANTTFTVTIKQPVVPTFSFGPTLTICSGSTPPALPYTSSNGVTGFWNPAAIDNQTSGTYTFTANPGQCAVATAPLTVVVTPTPTVGSQADTSVNDGSLIPANYLSGTPAGVSFNWTNSNTSIGLSAAGTGDVPSFTAVNKGNSSITGRITVVPSFNGCSGAAADYVVTVIPLNKDVFVPNVFTPNGDGKNDILYAYGNYVSKLEMRIFNQWGQQIKFIDDPHQGWDGKYNGTPQPVGVYVYTLKAVMTDGRVITLKGNVTLLR